ncbi:MAG: hypothetical protein QOE33_3046 [Acidobacteriota bacterium]|nr:hypothetical protein [Acidobacteriota bacterium]
MQEGESESELNIANYDVAIVGRALDDRGRSAVNFLAHKSVKVVTIEYDPDEFKLDIDGTKLHADDFETFLVSLKRKSIILESTTLGFVEMFLCCRALWNLGATGLSFLYVEPLNYSLRETTFNRSQVLHKRDFGLSVEVPGYKAIPGATLILTDRVPQRTVFFLGYEERRLDRALEDHQMIQPSSCSVVFGVPAFKPGWEMDAFANNIRVIKERNIRGGIHFCGAENPASAIEVLNKISQELVPGERLFIGPIGTKPMGVGVALFASTRPNVGVLYDHPKRREKRSSNVARWHLYEIEFQTIPL